MSVKPVLYSLRGEADFAELVQSATETFAPAPRELSEEVEVFYDTFDWRILRAGQGLALSGKGGRQKLRWEPLERSPRLRVQGVPIRRKPRFARELPDDLQEAVAEVTSVRRLFPMLETRTESGGVDLLDAEDKTVARLIFLRRTSRLLDQEGRQAGAWGEPQAYCLLDPIKGYDACYEELKRLCESYGSTPGSSLIEVDLQRLGEPLAFAPRAGWSVSLRRDQPAGEGLRTVLSGLERTLSANEAGVQAGWDIEFLHDYRIAVRRTRSALNQIRGVLPETAVRHYAGEFRWLGEVTGPGRDLDVLLEKLPSYGRAIGAKEESLAGLLRCFEEERAVEARALKRALKSQRYRDLQENWRSFLASATNGAAPPNKALKPIDQVAKKRIWRRYMRIVEEGSSFDSKTPIADLHRLRIQCKKLRYLLELFGSLFPKRKGKRALRELKRFQNALGDMNDCDVHAGLLLERCKTPRKKGRRIALTPEDLVTAGRLVAYLDNELHAQKERFLASFPPFASRENRQRYRELFHDG